MELFERYILEYSLLLGLIFVLLFIWNIVISIKLGKLKTRFNRFTRGNQTNNLEDVIEKYINEAEEMKKNIKTNQDNINFLIKKLESYKGKLGIVRYNAFGEEGNDLSYSIAMLDEKKSGVVITSIYNRGESNTYAKPIENGVSNYKLSKEELEVIEKAVK